MSDGYKYSRIETSIENTSFRYITNLDDYKAMGHILNVLLSDKINKPILAGVFKNIIKIFNKTTERLSHMTSKNNHNIIDQSKLEKYIKDKSERKIILVKNEEYQSFASFSKGLEVSGNLEKESIKTILYNVGQLETSGSISVIPTNANVFLSSILYAYALMFSKEFYQRQNVDVLINISKIIYTVILSSFGRKSGLLIGSRLEKEKLFFLCASFVYSIYAKSENNNSDKLLKFLRYSASNTGSQSLKDYLIKITNINLTDTKDAFNPINYDTLFKLSRNAKFLNLLQVSETDIRVQLFRLLGLYGMLGFENYPRLVAYLISTYLPNTYFSSTLKVYQKQSYEYLVTYYIKELFSIGGK